MLVFPIRNSIVLGLVALLLAACAPKLDRPIADVRTMPQNAGAYHGLPGDKPLLSPAVQAVMYADFLKRHFAPWHREAAQTPPDWAFWALDRFKGKALYGQNTRHRDDSWLERMREASQPETYPSMARPAVTLEMTSMRALPTNEPVFYDFSKAGEGFPFDYNQNTLVPAGTPLFVTHSSADGRYVLAECRYAFGWIPVRDVAYADESFRRDFEAQSLAAFIRDDVAVRDAFGIYRLTAGVGTVLPVYGHADGGPLNVMVPVRMPDGLAAAIPAALPEGVAVNQPLAPTPDNFAAIADAVLGKPYGWGGLYEDRDCSALTMDIMTPFGIYLPRNSSQQAKHGRFTTMDMMAPQLKKDFIAEAATPFLTLVRSPGHIMLYIGNHDGEPAILHAMWGVKTRSHGKEGRHVVGKAVVTTLSPGSELPDIERPLIDTVTGVTDLKPATGDMP
ncbi:NlpC/P60 family N-terminal domain-containing protein [Salidesulfovibrio brasiliensis]|uniref:NlpC/P60 family N-terminal domain-containing protein n=1 Tax=Salidesulfovibrio brasiliensis TaxID=221711 RepID=UPI0006CF32A7|nr:NlpC/P60 family N-terminal domain-containing protein [Salidesulfovibrio brasiliensis]